MRTKGDAISLLALIGGLISLGGPATSHAATLPTVPTFYNTTIAEPHYPNFWSVGETATLTSSTWWSYGKSYTDYKLSVTAPASSIYDYSSGFYQVGNPTVQITAYFDPYGHLLTNYGGRSFNNSYAIYAQGTKGSGTPALPGSANPTAGTPPPTSNPDKRLAHGLFQYLELSWLAVPALRHAAKFGRHRHHP